MTSRRGPGVPPPRRRGRLPPPPPPPPPPQRSPTPTLPGVARASTDTQRSSFGMTGEASEVFADPAIIVPARRPQIAHMLAPMLSLDPAKLLQLLARPGPFSVLAHNVTPDRA